MMEKVEAFYRESAVRTSNFSADSGIVQISLNRTYDHVSPVVPQCDPHQKINVNRESSIILAGNSPRESEFRRSIDSFDDSRHSTILAGRLDDKDFIQDTQNVTAYSEKTTNESFDHNKGILEISLETADEDIDIGLHGSELLSHGDNHNAHRKESLDLSNRQPLQSVIDQEANQRDQTLKILFQQFVNAPKNFTERLVTTLEQFVRQPTLEKTNTADYSVNRLSEKFGEIGKQYCKKIDDETMPDLGVSQLHFLSFLATETLANFTSGSTDTTARREIASPLQNYTKLVGDKKVHCTRKQKISTHCITNRHLRKSANDVYEAQTSGSPLSTGTVADEFFDTTRGFETLEELCRSIEDVGERVSQNKNTSIILLNNKNDTEKFAKDLTSPILVESSRTKIKINQQNSHCCNKPYVDEIREILNAGLVEKRRKCFEPAIEGYETQKRPTINKTSGSSSKEMDEKDIPNTSGHNQIFLNTMSACMDYFQDLQAFCSYRNSLECISESTKESESMENSMPDSKSLEFVQTFFVPAQNCAHYQLNVEKSCTTPSPESGPKKTNFIAETCIYLPGNSQNPTSHTGVKSSKKNITRSSTRKAFSTTRATHLLRKKNKILINKDVQPCLHSNVSRTPLAMLNTPKRLPTQLPVQSNSPITTGLNLENDSPNYTDVRNPDKLVNTPPIITITDMSSPRDSPNQWNRLNILDKSIMIDCPKKLNHSNNATPKSRREKKYFWTPGRTPTVGSTRPKKRFFDSPN